MMKDLTPCGEAAAKRSERRPGAGILAATALWALAGCSGADFERLGSDFADHVASNAGVDPAGAEKPGEREARARDFARRSDRLEVTAARDSAGMTRPGECAGDRCLWQGIAADGTRSVADLFPADIAGVALEPGTRQMTGFEYRPTFGPNGRSSWGVWMQHGVFGIAEEPGWTRNVTAFPLMSES